MPHLLQVCLSGIQAAAGHRLGCGSQQARPHHVHIQLQQGLGFPQLHQLQLLHHERLQGQELRQVATPM